MARVYMLYYVVANDLKWRISWLADDSMFECSIFDDKLAKIDGRRLNGWRTNDYFEIRFSWRGYRGVLLLTAVWALLCVFRFCIWWIFV